MGFRLSEEGPRNYRVNLPFDLTQANRVTNTVKDMGEENAAFIRERGQQNAQNLERLVNAPLDAYRTAVDRRDARDMQKAQRAVAEEQLKNLQLSRQMDEQFGARERAARVASEESRRDLTAQQLAATQEEADFLRQPSQMAGYEGQTNRQAQMQAALNAQMADVELKKGQQELTKAQIDAQKDLASLNKANAQIEYQTRKMGLDEAQRANRVRDLTARLAMASNDADSSAAIASELASTAKPEEYAEAMNAVRSNKSQQAILQTEIARRDPNYGFLVSKMQEGTQQAQQLSVLSASLDDALRRYTDARTPWSDEATDALKSIQQQLEAAGYSQQAKDLDSVMSWSLGDIGVPRQQRAANAIRNLQRSLGNEYTAKFGHLGEQYKNYGQTLVQRSFSAGKAVENSNPFKNQQPQNLTVPTPTNLGPNFYQQIGPQGIPQQMPQQMPQQTIPANQFQNVVPQNGGLPWMSQQQNPQLPPSFKPKKQVTQGQGR